MNDKEVLFGMTFPTHEVRVKRVDGLTICWKATHDKVDFAVFDDDEAALDYIIAPFPSLFWHIEFQDDEV